MKYGQIGNKKMHLMPRWLWNLRNFIFVFIVFILTFACIWVFYVLLEISHI